MDPEFWRERWQKGQIGFHEAAPNSLLGKHGARLGLEPGGRVLVPLCGKSTDLVFLARAGLAVTGIEIVREAVDAFYAENRFAAEDEPWLGFAARRAVVEAGSVRIALGSFFDLRVPDAERFDAAYDRAALVAVRPEDRERYVASLLAALRPGGRVLLVTFAYWGGTMTGPPFSVDDAEVKRLFAGSTLEQLDERDVLDSEPRFRERGATAIVEQAWLVTLP
jgi:thiopurine S-methyltransferase